MNINEMFDKNEKPLDKLIESGGFSGIFKTIGCIGDSLASGEFESLTDEGIVGWHDYYEYSWVNYISIATGAEVRNFSRGGMTAKEFCENYAAKTGAFNMENRCQCYIMALGVNDLKRIELGNAENINVAKHRSEDENTFADYYAEIIRRLKGIQPEAKFFLLTMPRSDNDQERTELANIHSNVINGLAKKFTNTYVIDLRKYGPVYDKEFKDKFYLAGHMNPMGYILTAKMIMSYIDYIIRHNMEDFKQVGFIGTPYANKKQKI